MEITTKVTIDMLTDESVSILTQKFLELDGEVTQVGMNYRKAYMNSEQGRTELKAEQPKATVNAVLAIWGDTPKVEENKTKERE